MNLQVTMRNCYGIPSLDYTFKFDSQHARKRSFAVYAPNGTMKSSFARAFQNYAAGEPSEDRLHGRTASFTLLKNNNPVRKENIYVYVDKEVDDACETVAKVLVNPKKRKEYRELVSNIVKAKAEAMKEVEKTLGTKRGSGEDELNKVNESVDLIENIKFLLGLNLQKIDVTQFPYKVIFDEKVQNAIQNPNFISRALDYSKRYEEVFEAAGSFLKKGIFNPAKASASFGELEKQDFFKAGHRVHIAGETKRHDSASLKLRMDEINKAIDSDDELKQIRADLARNANVRSFNELFENLPSEDVDRLLQWLQPENLADFRNYLLADAVQKNLGIETYLRLNDKHVKDIRKIEELISKWQTNLCG